MQPEKPSVTWQPASSASFWINHASRTLLRLQEGRVRPFGFGMSQTQFARVEQPTMAEMLARMERDGVVQREPNPKDGRGSLTSLTRRSLLRLPEAKAALIEGEQEAMAGFTPEEKALLLSLLRRVVDNIET